MMTTHSGIFAGGDMFEGDRTVTTSVGHGKKAAKYINAWLRHTKVEPKAKKEAVKFEELNTWYYTDAPAAVRARLDATRRAKLCRASMNPPPCMKLGAACPVATASSAITASESAPTTPSKSSALASALRSTWTNARAVASA